jgi:hypothetical protein
MIISKIQGGLGNQMFQYAAGVAAAKRFGTQALADISWFAHQNGDTHRRYELSVFNIKTFNSPFWWNYPVIRDRIYSTIKEPKNLSLSKPFFKLQRDKVILSGYWQSEQYFIDVEQEIRKLYSFPKCSNVDIKRLSNQIIHTNAVSLHIRRGDYANNTKTKAFHGLLPLSYYKKAIDYISSNVSDPVYYVFSDDLDWANKNLKSNHPLVFVSHDGSAYEDMRLMSLCKHHIIANSSFSWWGTWLNKSKNKIVVAPKVWIKSSTVDTSNIVPTNWIKL